jgi:hypothetical protein
MSISSQSCRWCFSITAVVAALAFTSSCRPGQQEVGSDVSAALAGSVGEGQMGGLVAFRDDILKVNNRAEVDAFLINISKNFDSYPSEVKFVAAQMKLLKPLEAIVYRAEPLFRGSKATHSVALTAVQQAASTLRTYLPTAQWQAVFEYVTQPASKAVPQYPTVEALQDDIERVVIPLLSSVILDLQKLSISDSKPVVWDNRIYYGPASFRDAHDRFVKIGKAEHLATISSLQRYLADLRMVCSYNLNDTIRVAQKIGTLYGVDGFFFQEVKGAPMMARAGAVRAFPNFLTLRERSSGNANLGHGPLLMKQALSDILASHKTAVASWSAVQDRASSLGTQVDNYWAMNPRTATTFKRQMDLNLKETGALLSGPTQVASAVTNEVVALNVPSFFENPPRDLKVFLPTAFVTQENIKAGDVTVDNYLWGSPTAWNAAAFKTYIPSINSSEDVQKTARILSQSWGGMGVGAVLAPLIN